MIIQFDIMFENESDLQVKEIVEYIEENGKVLFDRRREYPDGIKGSRFGGLLCIREINDDFTIKFLKDYFVENGLIKKEEK
ncbi:MAG: hypothetical protein ACRC7S_09255 [Cetobacterium sp.]